ncbi:hypothetical protein EXN66_Car012776 [Channa argus]|uniref:Uncharacterized protein n=1 Tax=Channa argus TaxID=215402 RepID=A0A6G1Q4I7_CHAAH|nr:hypothetical protein EXN66_Car012776 [Channa argus]
MNEMLPEERQIVKALNPWLKLNSPSFSDRDRHHSLFNKSLLRSNRESTRDKERQRERDSECDLYKLTMLYEMLSQLFEEI